jgi:hypothetical protein
MKNIKNYESFKTEINEGFLDSLFGKSTVDSKDQNFVTPDGGFQKTIPENVKFFLQKRPNIRVNDLFFNTINNHKENILKDLRDIREFGQEDGGRTTKSEYNGVDIALTNLKNMSETISINKNFDLKSFVENAYKAVYEINFIIKRIESLPRNVKKERFPENKIPELNNLDYIKGSIGILIKDIEKIMK